MLYQLVQIVQNVLIVRRKIDVRVICLLGLLKGVGNDCYCRLD